MILYIAEFDEKHQIIAIWVKEKWARAPRVFDPEKHVFDKSAAAEFFGASREQIEDWLIDMQSPARRYG